jgi:glycosyltransferase involved in cell wall biosynthesis
MDARQNASANQRLRVVAWFAFEHRELNPYNALLYESVQRNGVDVDEFSPTSVLRRRYDVFHIHWPDHLLNHRNIIEVVGKSIALFALLDVARRRGARIVWTVHNLQAHERLHPRIERWFWRQLMPRLDGYVTLTRSAQQFAIEHHPALRHKPGFVIPIGHFRNAYPNSRDRRAGRARFGLPNEAKVLVFAGFIRPYKNIPALIDAFRAYTDADARLLIAGHFTDKDLEAEIRRRAAGEPRVVLQLRFLQPHEVDAAMNAADLVVLPFRDILNSASALLALSFNRPILVPNRGSLPELAGLIGHEWVMTYDGNISAAVLSNALQQLAHAPPEEPAPLDRFDWSVIGQDTVRAYHAIIRARRAV